MDCFRHFFEQFLGNFWQFSANFGNFWAIFGQNRAFSLAQVFSLAGVFFVQRINSDCLADNFGGRLEISTIRHRGCNRSSNHRRLCGTDKTSGSEKFLDVAFAQDIPILDTRISVLLLLCPSRSDHPPCTVKPTIIRLRSAPEFFLKL